MPEYETLDVLLEKNGDGYGARIVNSPVGQAKTTFASPFTADELKTFFARVAGRAPTSGSTLTPKQLVEQMGTRLFDAVFHDEVLTTYRRSRDDAERESKGLRVRLRLNDVPELADLPWEYLYDASRKNYLALSKETPIVRYLELPERVEPLAAPAPIRLLAVLASPKDRLALDVEGEWTRMQDALKDLVAQNKMQLSPLQPPTLDALRAQLRKDEYHILHFIGHGDYDDLNQQGILVFENDRGDARRVNEDTVAILLQDARKLRVVVLNACQGAQTSTQNPFAGTAPRLVQVGVPAVLAMQYAITDQAALDFSSELYKTLADGYPIDAAMNEARRAVYSNGNLLEWGTPVLFMRAEDGVLFDVHSDRQGIASVEQNSVQENLVSKKRYLDAALPEEVKINETVRLEAMIRLENSQGLRKLISSGVITTVEPEGVKTRGFTTEFETDQQGRLKNLALLLNAESNDFEVTTAPQKISLSPYEDSELVTFLMIPRRTGKLTVIIRVHTFDGIQVLNGTLESNGVGTLGKIGKRLVTFSLGTFGINRSGGGGVNRDDRNKPRGGGTGGVNISGGTVNVGGDIVGGNKIVQGDEIRAGGNVNVANIGAGAQIGQFAQGSNINQTQGASAQDLTALFSAIYKQIDALPKERDADKPDIKDAVKKIETEAAKGEQGNPNTVERWFKFLKDLAPDVLEVTAAALLNPVAGIAAAIRKIAEKARAEK